MGFSRSDILKSAKEHNVRFIRLQFTDILGVSKNVAITSHQIEKALDGELMFDGSSIEGFVRIEESDMYLRPDLDTWRVLPGSVGTGDHATARLICDIYRADGSPFEGDPRGNLKRVLGEARQMGYQFNVGPECEFFLFHRDPNGYPTTQTHDRAGYFDLAPVDRGAEARKDIVLTLEEMGFEVEAAHHEVAIGQHEIDFKYADALATADNVQTFKWVTKVIAQKHNLHATFMPKPLFGINGSGMHTNMSLFRGEKNAFFDADAPLQLSEVALHYIAGQLKYAPEFALVTNPLVNSYKRLVPGYEAPVYIAWSTMNRSAFIRIPARRGSSTRVELRCPDPASNPYLVFAATLSAGLEGVRQNLAVPKPVNANIFHMTPGDREAVGVGTLPGNLGASLGLFQQSQLMRRALGSHIFEKYHEAKTAEWDEYRCQVHQWELDRYLATY